MKTPFRCIVLSLLALVASCKSPPAKITDPSSYQQVHDDAILIDTHNDILLHTMEKGLVFDHDLSGRTHTDLNRLKQGGVDAVFFSVWCDGEQSNPNAFAMTEIDSLEEVLQRNPDRITLAPDARALRNEVNQGRIAAIIGIEGGHMIEDDLDKLTELYDRGARYMTLTWNNSTSWATSAADETSDPQLSHKGLTEFGKKVVGRMNELGMMVDISHVGEQTFWDVMSITTKPVLASHSSVYGICPHPRNLKDDQIKAIAKNGGVIQLNFYSGFLDPDYERKASDFVHRHQVEKDSLENAGMPFYLVEEFLYKRHKEEAEALRPPISLLIKHIDYIIQLVGADYVGLGSDFDGITSAPQGLDDVTAFPLITKALLENGYPDDTIRKILGDNLLRVMEANESETHD